MVSPLETSAFQILESIEADFEVMTWAFKISENNHVGGGNYAVLPVESFMKMSAKLARAEGLLRQLLDGNLDAGFQERVQRHFDPEPI